MLAQAINEKFFPIVQQRVVNGGSTKIDPGYQEHYSTSPRIFFNPLLHRYGERFLRLPRLDYECATCAPGAPLPGTALLGNGTAGGIVGETAKYWKVRKWVPLI
jgi:hypothetical protein